MDAKKINDNTRVDLHLHSVASDGTWTPEKLVDMIEKENIKIFAVTDHDTVNSISDIKRITKDKELNFIPGIELSGEFEKYSYHILGYGIDIDNSSLVELMNYNKREFENIDYESIKYLERKDLNVSIDEFKNYIHEPSRGGWKALNYTIDKSLCNNHKEYFNLFDWEESPFKQLALKPAKYIIETIHNAGGIAVLAHPGASYYSKNIKHVIDSIIESGIDGIECYHPENDEEITQYCVELCKRNNLLITGGSDCHGEFLKSRNLCKPEVFLHMLKLGEIMR